MIQLPTLQMVLKERRERRRRRRRRREEKDKKVTRAGIEPTAAAPSQPARLDVSRTLQIKGYSNCTICGAQQLYLHWTTPMRKTVGMYTERSWQHVHWEIMTARTLRDHDSTYTERSWQRWRTSKFELRNAPLSLLSEILLYLLFCQIVVYVTCCQSYRKTCVHPNWRQLLTKMLSKFCRYERRGGGGLASTV